MATSLGPRRNLQPAWRQPAFWAVNGGLGCLAALGLIGRMRRHRAARNPYLQVRSEAARQARNIATRAVESARRNDALAFYAEARQSLRHFLATLDETSRNPESLTWEDLESILRGHSFNESSLTQIRELFGRKDEVHFAGWKPTAEELDTDRETFESLLNEIVEQKR